MQKIILIAIITGALNVWATHKMAKELLPERYGGWDEMAYNVSFKYWEGLAACIRK